MSKYITTYFYQDTEDTGASYGNIFLPFNQRNQVYWQTVYTLFYTSIVQNKENDIKYAFFTNVSSFPFRKEIESLGVRIFDDLNLTHRNYKQWATVKFFFDVIDYIAEGSDFNEDDIIIMLDSDCIATNGATELFNKMARVEEPITYVTSKMIPNDLDFHGLPISKLENIYKESFASEINIKETIGGEFFLFKKNQQLEKIRHQYNKLLNSSYCKSISTEEQILTMINAANKFINIDYSIYRIWTAYKNFDVCEDFNKYCFLHLPSEKSTGLTRLFNHLIKINKSNYNSEALNHDIYSYIPLHNPLKLYAMKTFSNLRYKLSKFFKTYV